MSTFDFRTRSFTSLLPTATLGTPSFNTQCFVADGSGMVYFNLQDRNVPKGIQIGKDARSLVLETNDDLTKVRHFGLEYDLHNIEVRTFVS